MVSSWSCFHKSELSDYYSFNGPKLLVIVLKTKIFDNDFSNTLLYEFNDRINAYYLLNAVKSRQSNKLKKIIAFSKRLNILLGLLYFIFHREFTKMTTPLKQQYPQVGDEDWKAYLENPLAAAATLSTGSDDGSNSDIGSLYEYYKVFLFF